MKFIMTSFGSLGDIMPFIALAVKLREKGHEAVFALPDYLCHISQKYGFETVKFDLDISEEVFRFQIYLTEGSLTQERIRERDLLYAKIVPQVIQRLRSLCRKADVLVGLYNLPFLSIIQEKTKIPLISLRVAYPGFESLSVNLPQMAVQEDVKNKIDHLILNTFSPLLLKGYSEISGKEKVTGFFYLEEQYKPEPGLLRFIEKGEPLIVFTLGSTIHNDPDKLSNMFVEVVTHLKCRGVIHSGWSQIGKNIDKRDNIYVCDYVPFRWLFSKATCIVHHGGAGTTAASLYAGKPAIVIPHNNDQFQIANNLSDLLCVGRIIPYKDLTYLNITEALSEVLVKDSYQRAAEKISKKIKAEDGTETAYQFIKEFLDLHDI